MDEPGGSCNYQLVAQYIREESSALQARFVHRRLAMGECLRIARGLRGWSVETAAASAGIGHMTWRRVEDGYQVRAKTYAALDKFFELPAGLFQSAYKSDSMLVRLAADLGVELSDAPDAPAAIRQLVDSLAGVDRVDIPAADLQRQFVDVESAMAEAYRNFGPLPTKRLLSHAEQLLGTFANAADQSDEMEAVRENHRRTVDMLRGLMREGHLPSDT